MFNSQLQQSSGLRLWSRMFQYTYTHILLGSWRTSYPRGLFSHMAFWFGLVSMPTHKNRKKEKWVSETVFLLICWCLTNGTQKVFSTYTCNKNNNHYYRKHETIGQTSLSYMRFDGIVSFLLWIQVCFCWPFVNLGSWPDLFEPESVVCLYVPIRRISLLFCPLVWTNL